jgi:hypothetical protein
MRLHPFDKFKAIIAPFLSDITKKDRESVLRAMYDLATEKTRMERVKVFTVEHVKPLRGMRMKLERRRAHLKNAIKELRAAYKCSPDTLLTVIHNGTEKQIGCDLKHLISQLEVQHESLVESERTIALSIHPELRTPSENKQSVFFAKYVTPLPGTNVTAIDYWFISELESCLSQVGSRTTAAVDEKRTKIIAKTFEAAFAETYSTERVKTARKRLRGRPRLSSPSLPGQKD